MRSTASSSVVNEIEGIANRKSSTLV